MIQQIKKNSKNSHLFIVFRTNQQWKLRFGGLNLVKN